MPQRCSKIWFLSKTTPKSLLKKGWVNLGFSCFWRPDSKMAPEWAPDLQNHQKITKNTDFLSYVQAFLHFGQQILSQICCTEFNMFCIVHLIVPPSCWPSHAVEQKSWTSSSQSELLFHVSRISYKHMIWLLLLASVFAVPGSKPFRLEKVYILRL